MLGEVEIHERILTERRPDASIRFVRWGRGRRGWTAHLAALIALQLVLGIAAIGGTDRIANPERVLASAAAEGGDDGGATSSGLPLDNLQVDAGGTVATGPAGTTRSAGPGAVTGGGRRRLRPGCVRHRDQDRRLDVHVGPRRGLWRADRGGIRGRRQLRERARRDQRSQGRIEDLRRRRRPRQATRERQATRRGRQGVRTGHGVRADRRCRTCSRRRFPCTTSASSTTSSSTRGGSRWAVPNGSPATPWRTTAPARWASRRWRSSTWTPAPRTTAGSTPKRWRRTGTPTASTCRCWRRSRRIRHRARTPSARRATPRSTSSSSRSTPARSSTAASRARSRTTSRRRVGAAT